VIPLPALVTSFDPELRAGNEVEHQVRVRRRVGSPNLERILAANKELFSGDVSLICDGPFSQTRRQSITFGSGGISMVDITVYGPRSELRSGHYGNWAPNPAMLLARLLTSM
jgi:hypothetical protein